MDTSLIIILAVLIVSGIIGAILSKPIHDFLWDKMGTFMPMSALQFRQSIAVFFAVIIAAALFVVLFSTQLLKL